MSGDELVVPVYLHPRNLWMMLRVSVPGRAHLRLVVDSGCFASVVKEEVLQRLVTRGRATFAGGRRFTLHDVMVGGVRIPDIPVRSGGSAERIDADGIVGLDYLGRFARVCVDVQELRLRLSPRAAAA